MGTMGTQTIPADLLTTGSAANSLHDPLAILWFLLIAVLLLGYFILDGFDLGAGILSPFVAKRDDEKKFIRRAIGPLWDGNEVWLLTAGGALFAAFAPAYATSFSGFYLAIMLVLFGLIFRAVAVEYADRDTSKAMKKFWNGAFFLGSAVPALLFGAAIGNVIQGVTLGDASSVVDLGENSAALTAIAAGTDYIGGFFALLNPFALLCGVMGLVAFITQGAAWLALKSYPNSDLHARVVKIRSLFNIITLVCFVLVSAWFFIAVFPTIQGRGNLIIAIVFAVICALGWVATRFFIAKKNDLLAFIGVNVTPVALIGITAATLFPVLIPASNNATPYFLFPGQDVVANHMTLFSAANSEVCLTAMIVITCIGLPLVLLYHVIIYRTFRGRISMEDDLDY